MYKQKFYPRNQEDIEYLKNNSNNITIDKRNGWSNWDTWESYNILSDCYNLRLPRLRRYSKNQKTHDLNKFIKEVVAGINQHNQEIHKTNEDLIIDMEQINFNELYGATY